MNVSERALRDEICRWGESLFARGYTAGSSGNLSARLSDGFLVTPTNACLGFLEPSRLAKLDGAGVPVSGDPPTKEIPLHMAFYDARPQAGAVVHLHSTCATALSCLDDIDHADTIPPMTPYVVMRVGSVPLVPYVRPGSACIGPLVAPLALRHCAMLLANHGQVVSAPTLRDAVFAAEELEETAKLVLLARNLPVRLLSREAIAELESSFKLR